MDFAISFADHFYSSLSKIKYFQEKRQTFYKVNFIDDFGFSDAILLRGVVM